MNFCLHYTGDPNEEREWVFTFGSAHHHPTTGEPLARRFVRIKGTWLSARKRMLALFGQKWSMQYDSAAAAGVERYGLRELVAEATGEGELPFDARAAIEDALARFADGVCRVCGCTDDDCSQCVEKTGAPCWWVEPDLCSACEEVTA
jgi:hypothetical protein